jgi:hypothetical protein
MLQGATKNAIISNELLFISAFTVGYVLHSDTDCDMIILTKGGLLLRHLIKSAFLVEAFLIRTLKKMDENR